MVSTLWISASDSYGATWVTDIEKELLKKEYWMIYANDPRTPQKEVLRLLNRAAKAHAANDVALAQQLAREAPYGNTQRHPTFEPPAPVTKDFNVWKDGKPTLCTQTKQDVTKTREQSQAIHLLCSC